LIKFGICILRKFTVGRTGQVNDDIHAL